jgi:hypothetical protein
MEAVFCNILTVTVRRRSFRRQYFMATSSRLINQWIKRYNTTFDPLIDKLIANELIGYFVQ